MTKRKAPSEKVKREKLPPIRPYLIFGGTLTWLVRARDEEAAFTQWRDKNPALNARRDEVTIRPMAQTDAEWVRTSGSVRMALALKRVKELDDAAKAERIAKFGETPE